MYPDTPSSVLVVMENSIIKLDNSTRLSPVTVKLSGTFLLSGSFFKKIIAIMVRGGYNESKLWKRGGEDGGKISCAAYDPGAGA